MTTRPLPDREEHWRFYTSSALLCSGLSVSLLDWAVHNDLRLRDRHDDFEERRRSYYRPPPVRVAFRAAAAAGDVKLVQRLLDGGLVQYQLADALDKAARSGHLEVVRVLRRHDVQGSWGSEETGSAAQEGRLEDLQRLYDTGHSVCESAVDAAAAAGHMEVLKQQYEAGYPVLSATRASAAEHGHLHVLQYLHSVGALCAQRGEQDATMCSAASGGHLHVVQWLHDGCGQPLTMAVHEAATRSGNLDLLQWLHSRRCPLSAEACSIAAWEHGNFDMLGGWRVWLLDKTQCPLQAGYAREAVAHGHMPVLRTLCDRGCTLDAAVFEAAAGSGSLDALQLLREQKCPWESDAKTCLAAIREGHVAAVQWLRNARCPLQWPKLRDGHVAVECARRGDVNMLKWVVSNGCIWNEQYRQSCTVVAEKQQHTEVVEWLCSSESQKTKKAKHKQRKQGAPSVA
ncbi:hypothetical protein JKP88DRAFT_159249 [Tribonema minus]|uniref:Uncharacterized protein n=1 Tax=Tribonema minus TaxID=303371 RepID=A0A835YKW0_9STRA|nr:hypothetical protein JKP88DRAFT_159249 [Tribonema minus]